MKHLPLVLLALMPVLSSVQAQRQDWTLRYFEGKSGKLISLQHCRLDTLASDSLNISSKGNSQWVRLFLLYELERPAEGHNFGRPIWAGALIGAATGFISATLVSGTEVRKTDEVDPRLSASAVFAVIGAGLGLAHSIESEYVRYRFPDGSNPAKRAALNRIMEQEREHSPDGTDPHLNLGR